MGKKNKKKKAISAKVVKQLKKLISDKKIGQMRATAEELGDRFVAAAEQAALLEVAVQRGAGAVVDLLVESGVNADARPGLPDGQTAGPDDKLYVYDNAGPLMCLVAKSKFKKKDKVARAKQLLAAGASPMTTHPDLRIINPAHIDKAYSVLDIAVVSRAHDLVELFLPLCDEQAHASATVTMLRVAHQSSIANYWYSVDDPLDFTAIKRLLALGLPSSGVSRWGIPVAHAIAMFACPKTFELLAPQCADLASARIVGEPVVLKDCMGFASNETVTLAPGTSPRAAVHLMIGNIERGIEDYRREQCDDRVQPLTQRIEELRAISARLEQMGDTAEGGELVLRDDLRPLFDLFCDWVGRDAVEAFARSQDLTTLTPYLLAYRLAEQFASAELQQRLSHRPDHPIALLLDHARRGASPNPTEVSEWVDMFGDTEHNPAETLLVHPDDYHEDGRELLQHSRLFAAEGDTVWGASGTNGEGDIFAVSPDATVIHGSVNSLLQDFLDAPG